MVLDSRLLFAYILKIRIKDYYCQCWIDNKNLKALNSEQPNTVPKYVIFHCGQSENVEEKIH